MFVHLPHRVIIQHESRSLFQGGAYTTSWITDSTEWANCQTSNKNYETYDNGKKQQYTSWNLKMRYSSSITNKKRLLFGSHTLHIETVSDPTSRGKVVQVTCREENT